MMRMTFLLGILCIGLPGVTQQDDVRVKNFNIGGGLALDGYDPVSYFGSNPVEGKSDIKYTYKGITYSFVSMEHLNQFKANPENFEPAYGGWCAYAMGDSGEKVKVDPETFKIINGRLYLFYNFWGNDTLKDWNREESRLKSAADRNWLKVVGK